MKAITRAWRALRFCLRALRFHWRHADDAALFLRSSKHPPQIAEITGIVKDTVDASVRVMRADITATRSSISSVTEMLKTALKRAEVQDPIEKPEPVVPAKTKQLFRKRTRRRAAQSPQPVGEFRNVVTVDGVVIYPVSGETSTPRDMLRAHAVARERGLEPHLWDERGKDRY